MNMRLDTSAWGKERGRGLLDVEIRAVRVSKGENRSLPQERDAFLDVMGNFLEPAQFSVIDRPKDADTATVRCSRDALAYIQEQCVTVRARPLGAARDEAPKSGPRIRPRQAVV